MLNVGEKGKVPSPLPDAKKRERLAWAKGTLQDYFSQRGVLWVPLSLSIGDISHFSISLFFENILAVKSFHLQQQKPA